MLEDGKVTIGLESPDDDGVYFVSVGRTIFYTGNVGLGGLGINIPAITHATTGLKALRADRDAKKDTLDKAAVAWSTDKKIKPR